VSDAFLMRSPSSQPRLAAAMFVQVTYAAFLE
jgi:hypothetical protein